MQKNMKRETKNKSMYSTVDNTWLRKCATIWAFAQPFIIRSIRCVWV